jgi:hypothetical protein
VNDFLDPLLTEFAPVEDKTHVVRSRGVSLVAVPKSSGHRKANDADE